MTTRRLTTLFVSATFWWISLLAKRVSAESSAMTSASASVTPSRSASASAASARASASAARSSFIGRPPGYHLPTPTWTSRNRAPGTRVADVAGLARLALAAVRRAEHHVAPLVADRVARAPELVGDAGVGRVLEQPALPAALDLVGDLGRELEVEPPVVDRPGAVRGEVEAVVGVGDDLVEAHPGLRQQVDVRHPDERDPVPAVGPHRAAAPPADPRRGLAAGQVADEDARSGRAARPARRRPRRPSRTCPSRRAPSRRRRCRSRSEP